MDRRKRKKIRTEGLVGRIFILCLLAVMIINFIVPDRESSDEENRMLTSRAGTERRIGPERRLYGSV